MSIKKSNDNVCPSDGHRLCRTYAQGVKNDSTATAKAEGLKLVKDVYPQTEEDGDLYHGLTRKLMFDRMIPPHGLEVTYDKTVHILFPVGGALRGSRARPTS